MFQKVLELSTVVHSAKKYFEYFASKPNLILNYGTKLNAKDIYLIL
jgi:hypothetical protein